MFITQKGGVFFDFRMAKSFFFVIKPTSQVVANQWFNDKIEQLDSLIKK